MWTADKEPFSTVYDLDDCLRQVPGARYRYTGVSYKCEGCPANGAASMTTRGRVIALTFDSDLGDSWEFADDPVTTKRSQHWGFASD